MIAVHPCVAAQPAEKRDDITGAGNKPFSLSASPVTDPAGECHEALPFFQLLFGLPVQPHLSMETQ